jgi:hypothetical protein
LILRDHSHLPPDDTGICPHCGQAMPAGHGHVHGYGDKRVSHTGLAITVLLHVLLLLAFLLRPHTVKPPPPPEGGSIAYIAPPPSKPKAPPKPVKVAPAKRVPERIDMVRLPNTITVPKEPPPPPPRPEEAEPPKIVKADPAEDMAAMIEARRRARGQSEQPAEESEAERGNRIARANIGAANGRSVGDGRGESKGMLSVTDLSFNSAQVKLDTKYLGINRISLKQETATLGGEIDIETAAIKKMIDMIARENIVDFTYTTRSERKVALSTRPEFRAELQAFLMKEIFPNYRPPRNR